MHWTTHVVTGAAVGYLLGSPLPAAAAGFTGHLLLDTFPHHDPEGQVPYVLDSLAGLAVIAAIAKSRSMRRADPRRAALWGAVGAGLPDVELLAKLVATVEREDYHFPTHSGLIPHRHMNAAGSGVSQLALAGLTLATALLKWKRRKPGGGA